MGKFCSFNKYLFSACVSHTKAMDQVSGKDKMAVQDDAQASGFGRGPDGGAFYEKGNGGRGAVQGEPLSSLQVL